MPLSLASFLTNNAVLQREMPVPIWGGAQPGTHVHVQFQDQQLETATDEKGDWNVTLRPMPAIAEGSSLVVTAGDERIELTDVVVGEVWLCSGQSNMEWAVVDSANAREEIANADHPMIRLLTVPRCVALEQRRDFGGDGWQVCSPGAVSPFSAVGYYFGRKLHEVLGVPIGLINSSYGGTPAEAWTSREGLLAYPEIAAIWNELADYLSRLDENRAKYQEIIRAFAERTRDQQNKGFALGYAATAEPPGEWGEMQLPSIWQRRGLDFNGIVWFRKIVNLPDRWIHQELQLAIGSTDKSDVTYFNGEQVGSITMQQREDSWKFQRVYPLPGRLVDSNVGVIAVRVHSDKADAGMRGPAYAMHLTCPACPNDPPIPLTGPWKYCVEENYGKFTIPPALPGEDNPHTPTSLFNGMIAPLVGSALRGAIWYQGESNADRAEQYRTLFPALIEDWRRKWKRDDLAFHFVQLANYYERLPEPAESKWAKLRDAQASALRLTHTGMAVAIDVGEAGDIHPRDKQSVGNRLAASALNRTYGKVEGVPSGPTFVSVELNGNRIRLTFIFAVGLYAKGGTVAGFAVAADDRVFQWANAAVDGEAVIIDMSATTRPRHVRYAWADNPACTLYNAADLPMAPFECEL